MKKKLYRSDTDKQIAGVCGGIAEYLNIDSTLVRLLWAFLTFFAGAGIWMYIIAAFIMPENPGCTPYSDVNNQQNQYSEHQNPYDDQKNR